MLNAHEAGRNGPKELAEVKSRLKLAEQLQFRETTQKQPFQEAFEKEKSKLLNEIATLHCLAARTKNQVNKIARWSKFKTHAEAQSRR